MSRYIDADIAHKMLLKGYVITDVPTADVVEVVRCKDCKYYREYGECFVNALNGEDTVIKVEVNDF